MMIQFTNLITHIDIELPSSRSITKILFMLIERVNEVLYCQLGSCIVGYKVLPINHSSL